MKTKKAPASATITNPAILPIEAAAHNYADARAMLASRLTEYQKEIARLREIYLPGIKLHASVSKDAQSRLESLIAQNKDLFQEPRTITLHGIKLGLQKGKGKVEFEDAEKVVERIKAQFTKAEAELLLDVKVTPRKDALMTLEVAALKKLGVTITGTGDAVVIKAANGDVDKLVAQILEEDTSASKKEAA